MNIPKAFISSLLRIFLGFAFIAAAILKLFSIDEFEIYIFSFNIFNFVLVGILSRFLIACELLLGVFLIFKIHYKLTWYAMLVSLVGFTLFLIYVLIYRNDANCHCFGDLVELNPIESIIKNIVMAVLLLAVKNETESSYKYKKLIAYSIILISIIIPFLAFPTDTLYHHLFVSNEINIDAALFEKAKNDSAFYNQLNEIAINENDSISFSLDKTVWNINEGKYIMAFVASSCKYCKIGIKKINMILKQNEIEKSNLKIIIWGNKEISTFIKETNTFDNDYYIIKPITAVNITLGTFPRFVFIENGSIVKVCNYRDIDNKSIDDFFMPSSTYLPKD